MKVLVGSPGTVSGLMLRLGQCLFAAASIGVMVSALGFSNYTAFCYLIASMGLQVLWSLGLACLDFYALRVKRDLHNPVLVSLFVVGDWVTAILSLAAACSSAGVAVLFARKKRKAAEEHKRNIMEYRSFLESCDFIKACRQWRKVQDRMERDERCSQLDKFVRLKKFQGYVNDLEKEEEEQQKIQKEQLRKAEHKNRDDFHKLMEDHVVAGILTAKTYWRDYYMEVKDLPSYMAVSSNTLVATPKYLFKDVTMELEKQICVWILWKQHLRKMLLNFYRFYLLKV